MYTLKIIFWASFIIVIYTYFLYPLMMVLFSRFNYRPVQKKEYMPNVSLIISAYNEEKNIEEKIKNIFSLDYPKDKLEIIVASDGSNDNTVSILEKYIDRGIKLLVFKDRVGKTKAQNEAVRQSSGEILFFSDVTSLHNPGVIKKLMRNFANKTVGCVTGKVVFSSHEESLISWGAGLRLKYELFLRERQSNVHSLFGATGCIYAIRKDLYEPLRGDLVSDFVEPLIILEKGYRTVYEPEAIAFINRKIDLKKEFTRRIRVIQQGLFGLFFMKKMLNPFRYGLLSFSLISHRLLRWLMPLVLIVLFIVNIFLINKKLYMILMIMQIIFYLTGVIGLIMHNKNKLAKFIHPVVYFCMINAAAVVGLYKFLMGKRKIYWETLR